MAENAIVPFTDSDAGSLSQALTRLIGSKETRAALSVAARERWKVLDPAVRIKDLEAIFQKASGRV